MEVWPFSILDLFTNACRKLWNAWNNRQRLIIITKIKNGEDSVFETNIENRINKNIEIKEVGFITSNDDVYRQQYHNEDPIVVINPLKPIEPEQSYMKRVVLSPRTSVCIDRFDISVKLHFKKSYPNQNIKYVYALDSNGKMHRGSIADNVRSILDI